MTTVTFRTARTAFASSLDYIVNVKDDYSAAAVNTVDQRPVYVLSSWTRHGTQPDYWTETWLQKEKLADWDEFIGNVYESDDVEEMIRLLDA